STAAENADSLTFSASKQAVDGTDPGNQRLTDRLTFQRTGRDRVKVAGFFASKRTLAVDGFSKAIENPAEQIFSRLDAGGFAPGNDRVTQLQAVGLFER